MKIKAENIKKEKKKSSENDQLTGHFQSFFIFYFFRPPDPKSDKKNPVNQLIKNSGLIRYLKQPIHYSICTYKNMCAHCFTPPKYT